MTNNRLAYQWGSDKVLLEAKFVPFKEIATRQLSDCADLSVTVSILSVFKAQFTHDGIKER